MAEEFPRWASASRADLRSVGHWRDELSSISPGTSAPETTTPEVSGRGTGPGTGGLTRCRREEREPSRVVGTFVNGITKMGAARSRSLRSIKARSRTSSGTRRRPLERAKAAVRCWCAACPPQGRWWATDDGFGLGGEHEAFEHGGRRDRRAVLAAILRDFRAVSGVPDHIGASKRRSIAWARSSMRRRSTAPRAS